MCSASALIAAGCLLLAPACISSEPEAFSVDPDPRAFVLPARPMILFFVDGLRPDLLEELAERGELPRLQRLLFDRAAHVRTAVTCVPSVTFGNAVSMLTGCWPSTHGAWANAWFDREQLETRNYQTQRECGNEDESRPTLFELLDGELTAGVALPFERGVKISRVQSARTGGAPFGLSWILGDEQGADERLSEQFQDISDQAHRVGEWPAFIAVYLPAADEVAHELGCDSPEYRDAVRNLDQAIGEVLEGFERGGMLDKLTIVLTSDHGHLPTPNSLDLEPLLAAALKAPLRVSEVSDGEAPYIERWERYAPARAVVVRNGMRVASVSLRAGNDWSGRPTLEQMLTPDDLPERILSASHAVEPVAVRAGEHEVRVYTREGSAAIRRVPDKAGEPAFSYEVLSGDDPLGYDGDEGLREWLRSAHGSREWLAATAELSRPDLVPQLLTAFDDPHSGDLILFAAPGWDFSPEQYDGGHGGLQREELVVPLYFAGPGIRAGAELPVARLVDVVPTLLDLAGVELPASVRFDGVSLAPQLR